MKTEYSTSNLNVYNYILKHLKPFTLSFSIFIFFALLSGLYSLTAPNITKIIIDNLTNMKGSASMLKDVLLPCFLFVINLEFFHLTWRGMAYINYKIEPLIKSNIINDELDYVMKQSHSYFQNNLAGEISNNINILANNIQVILHENSRYIIRTVIMIICALINMYYIHPIFFLIFVVWIIIFVMVGTFYSGHIGNLAYDCAEKESEVAGQVVDKITNAFTILFFRTREFELKNLKPYLSNMVSSTRREMKFRLIFYFFQGLSITIMLGFMLYILSSLYVKNMVTVGDFALIISLSLEIGYSLWSFMEVIGETSQAIGKCRKSLSSIFKPLEIVDKPGATELRVTDGTIKFDKVTFKYQNNNSENNLNKNDVTSNLIFDNKSITINAKEKVALVGYSGSGKSTFINLILRLYNLNEGKIFIDDQDISQVTQDSLLKNISVIPQEPVLFYRSLIDNIKYGKLDATYEEVIEAAKKAQIHDFIMQLPENYDYIVGERGSKLSGGQRQRIAIARAFLKNAPLLILDEATSQLDPFTESNLQKALMELMSDKTTIIIAHRLSTIISVDRILVFDEGKIIEQGKHSELINKNGLYTKLWNAQIGGFLQY